MSFKCGIVGLPNVGKSTLFNALTNSSKAQAANFPFCTIDPNVGVVPVPDDRLDNLSKVSKSKKIIVIHGTDTMHQSAKFISKFIKDKIVIFTGAMKPYEINPIEATSNLMLAIGFSQNAKEGIYISMHGIVKKYNKIKKDYKKGIFIANN